MDTPIKIPKSETMEQMTENIYYVGIFRAALELQVWEKVSAGYDTAVKMAAKYSWDPAGTRILLDSLCALKLMNINGEQYQLTPEAEYYLLPSMPAYMGDMSLADFRWEGNGQLAQTIRTGKRPIKENATQASMAGYWQGVYARSWAYPEIFLDVTGKIWQSVDILPFDGLRILDIACGPAPKSFALTYQHPGVHLTLLDWEDVLQMSLKAAKNLEIEKQVTLMPGDLWLQDFGISKFNVAYLGDITHFFSPEDNLRLFQKVYRSLVNQGVIIINLFDRRESQLPAWVEMWLYAVTPQGGIYSFEEYLGMLQEAGFTHIKDVNQGPIKALKP